MGQEIVYCQNCKTRLTGKEFEQGKAFRIENSTICLDCARKELAALPPAERDAYAAMMKAQEPKKTSTQRIPVVRSSDAASSTRLRMARGTPAEGLTPGGEGEAPKRPKALLLGLAGGGIVVVAVVILVVVLLSGRRPPTMTVESGPPTGGPVAPGDARLKEAQGLLEQAKAFQKANPDDFTRQLDLFGKAAWAGSGTPVGDQAKQEMALIQIRRAEKMSADLAQLNALVKPLLEKSDLDGATRLVDEVRNKYTEQEWAGGIRKITDEVDRLRNAPPVVVTPDPVPEVPMPVVAWSDLDPDEWKSSGGTALKKLDDRSILAPRTGPDVDVYTVTARSDLKGITAFRLEALADNSLPGRGPGRSDNGNFVLTEFKAETGGRPLAFKGSSSSHEQGGWPSSAAVDGSPLTGWAIMPRTGRNTEAVFHLQDAVDGGKFTFTLECLSAANPRHVLGRFRISATSAQLSDPPPARRTEKSSPPVSPAARAYRDRWKPAALLAVARDYEAAVRKFEEAKASLPDPAFKAEAEGDLADLKLAASLWAEVQALLQKWPAGQNLPAEILAPDGRRVRVDEPVRRSERLLFEIRPSPEARALCAGEILGVSLAELFLSTRGKPSDADRRAAGIFCALDGDAEAARGHLGGRLPEKLEEHALLVSAANAGPEAEARRKLREAVDGYFSPGTRAVSLERFAALRRDHKDSVVVRRAGAALEVGPEGLAEYVYAVPDLKPSGGFALLTLPKGEIAWVLGEDVPDREKRREQAVEAEYSAPASSEYRAWVLAGACCQETFTFYLQASDLEVPGETTGIPVRCDPGSAIMALVAHGLSGLKKNHAAHGGPKAPVRFEWIALPVLKHAAAGTKRIRIVSDQQGFAVAGLLVSSIRKAAPKEDEWHALESRRPRAWDLLEPAASSGSGWIQWEGWRDMGGEEVANLTGHKNFQGRPAEVRKLTALEGPRNWAENFGSRMRGYLLPPHSGAYLFWISSDNASELWLSTDDAPDNKKKVAFVKGAVGFDSWQDQPTQRSAGIRLLQGRRYYFEVLHKDGGGPDHVRVGWKIPDGPEERPIPGNRLAPYLPGQTGQFGVTLTAPAATGPQAASTVVLTVEVSGATEVSRVEILQGGRRLGEPKGSPPTYTWTKAPEGAYDFSVRVAEKGGRVGISAPLGVTVGEVYFYRAVDLNGSSDSISRRLWAGRETGGYAVTGTGHERLDVDLKPPTDPARARMIRSSVFAKEGTKVTMTEVPPGKYQVYLTVWEPRDAPQALEVQVNGKPGGTVSFQAPGEWARLGPWAAEPANGKIEVAATKGGGFFSGVELWSIGTAVAKPTQRVKTEAIGGGGGGAFEETKDGDPFLIGFKVTKKDFVKSLQGIWDGKVSGERHGNPEGPETEILAKPGYAVGGLRMRGGDRVRAFRVIFMKIVGPVLNPSDSYESDWYVGDATDTKVVGGDGSPVVGLHGGQGGDVDRLGIVVLK